MSYQFTQSQHGFMARKEPFYRGHSVGLQLYTKYEVSHLMSQSLTWGVNVLEPGMTYVALSRVRTLGGLALLNFKPSKVKANKGVHEEMERLAGLQFRTLQSQCVDNGGSSQIEEMEIEEMEVEV